MKKQHVKNIKRMIEDEKKGIKEYEKIIKDEKYHLKSLQLKLKRCTKPR